VQYVDSFGVISDKDHRRETVTFQFSNASTPGEVGAFAITWKTAKEMAMTFRRVVKQQEEAQGHQVLLDEEHLKTLQLAAEDW
jgi:hypothetical protein